MNKTSQSHGGPRNPIEALDALVSFMSDEVRVICVYFEGQDVEALLGLNEVKEKVERILKRPSAGFVPKFICQPRDSL
ncbi:hypothetical protein DL95DRAFT_20481 [Leptodontidium sp. 2 PMI_412]|nr:hypothetical protein DL95DRAFT_20481 [Leptodontidium sp. 2 PMI_412]